MSASGPAVGASAYSSATAVRGAAGMVRDYLAALPAGRFPNLIDVAGYFALGDPDERFELLLDLFVDGLAKRL